jgi:hypothetical protein
MHWTSWIVLLVIVSGVGSLAWWSARSVQQKRAVDRFQDRGARIIYRDGLLVSALPMWFRARWGGCDFWDSPQYVDASRSAVTDADLEQLKRIPGLSKVDLDNTAITDAGVAHLRSLKDLRKLDVSGTNVSDAAITRLQEALPNCEIRR